METKPTYNVLFKGEFYEKLPSIKEAFLLVKAKIGPSFISFTTDTFTVMDLMAGEEMELHYRTKTKYSAGSFRIGQKLKKPKL